MSVKGAPLLIETVICGGREVRNNEQERKSKESKIDCKSLTEHYRPEMQRVNLLLD
jgi:hypothetical protein